MLLQDPELRALLGASAQPTAGFSTVDPVGLDPAATHVLLFSMVTGGCSGSMAGVVKLVRLILVLRLIQLALRRSAGQANRAVRRPMLGKMDPRAMQRLLGLFRPPPVQRRPRRAPIRDPAQGPCRSREAAPGPVCRVPANATPLRRVEHCGCLAQCPIADIKNQSCAGATPSRVSASASTRNRTRVVSPSASSTRSPFSPQLGPNYSFNACGRRTLGRLLIETHDREPRMVGALVDLQHILHARDELCILVRRNHPTGASISKTTSCSASSMSVQRARPGGGSLQAICTRRACF